MYHKLTPAIIVRARTLLASNRPQKVIAAELGLSQGTISKILHKAIGEQVKGGPAYIKPRTGGHVPVRIDGMTVAEIAAAAGVTTPTIYARIRRGLTGKDLLAKGHTCKRVPHTRIAGRKSELKDPTP